MTVMSKGLPLNSKHIKNGRKEGGFQDSLSSFPYTATFCNCLPCGSVATLRRAYYFSGLWLWTLVGSCSGRGSAVVVSNFYQLA